MSMQKDTQCKLKCYLFLADDGGSIQWSIQPWDHQREFLRNQHRHPMHWQMTCGQWHKPMRNWRNRWHCVCAKVNHQHHHHHHHNDIYMASTELVMTWPRWSKSSKERRLWNFPEVCLRAMVRAAVIIYISKEDRIAWLGNVHNEMGRWDKKITTNSNIGTIWNKQDSILCLFLWFFRLHTTIGI